MSTVPSLLDSSGMSAVSRPQRAPHPVLPSGSVPVVRAAFRAASAPWASVRGSDICRAGVVRATGTADAVDYVKEEKLETPQGIPDPVVKIDNQTDRYHTVVSIQFGDRLGELLDTVAALKRLNLSIRKAKIRPKGHNAVHTFLVTDSHTADKIIKSARLEEIRFTILSNLLRYHPEAAAKMGGKWAKSIKKPPPHLPTEKPLGARKLSRAGTSVVVRDSEEGGFSEMDITTSDRPGLLTDIVKVLKDINVNVISAEVDTEGALAKDQFLISYHGDPLNSSMRMLVTNALQYYLGLAEVEAEESY